MAFANHHNNQGHELINNSNSIEIPVFGPHLGPTLLVRMDVHLSVSLLQFMAEQGQVPSPEEEVCRTAVIQKLKEIIRFWIQKVAWQRKLPVHMIKGVSATIMPFGSYGLGVHDSDSDIDALCIGPCFATLSEDFFVVLRDILKDRHEVSDIYCVEGAKVPLVRFKFDGIAIDLPYAQLPMMSVPENVDLLNPMTLAGIDASSWRSLSGVRVNQRILQLVPNLSNFQSLLRCVKFWAKRRGVYGNLFGFLAGIHLAILAAFVCQRSPDASLSVLVMNFFSTFASWPWPTPVALQDGVMPTVEYISDKRCLMPIILPCSPHEHCQSNMIRSTFNRIRTEFNQGHNLTKEMMVRPDFVWDSLFEPFVYQKNYSWFLKIYLAASGKDDFADWVGWVKSRFPSLIFKLWDFQGFCDPNPTEYSTSRNVEPSIEFYWGLRRSAFDVISVEKYFWNVISNSYQGRLGKMRLSIVPASAMPNCTETRMGAMKGMKACWRNPAYDQRRMPVFSQHLASHFVGYLASEGNRASTLAS